jgi:hypothetical protein
VFCWYTSNVVVQVFLSLDHRFISRSSRIDGWGQENLTASLARVSVSVHPARVSPKYATLQNQREH